ncbi:MAG TPA: LuxR C-terminal-related transcriptional regulator [Actinomycetota bacterium]|nr:LuxR C-terminal-related transcriptional regulator [Actinomycetota bacterium]
MSEANTEIRRARAAADRGSWREAYEALRDLDPSDLEPSDLELLADAAWWMSQGDASIAARQRAYTGYAAAGNAVRAAWMAARLSVDHFTRGEPAVGAGWLMKAQRQAEGVEETAGHGLLLVVEATVARYTGDLERAAELADRAGELARRFRDPDLTAMATHTRGLILIATGDIAAGVALLDEAMTSVVAGELSPFFTGIVYCNVIGACLELADVGRAGEWSDAARAWCESLPPESPFPGMCRINRAEVLRLRGAWDEAEAEATRASEELMSFDPGAAAQALYEIGEIRRRLGNASGAEDSFARARDLGFEPQPGLALLRMGQGKGEAALAALRVAASAPIESRLRRARVLAAQVDVALAMEDVETARTAVAELDAISTEEPIAALDATAATARGALALAEDDITTALDRLRHASGLWQRLGLPYEHAQARGLYGAALRAAGDGEEGDLELRAALSEYEHLGAVSDADRVARALGGGPGLPRGLTSREAEVLRLVAAGKTNREIASELVISEHTVARHLQNMFVKLQVSSRSAATAFAFEHGIT